MKIYLVVTPFFPEFDSFRGPYIYDQVNAIIKTGKYDKVIVLKPCRSNKLKDYIYEVLRRAMELRDNASTKQGRSLLKKAAAYIDRHYTEEKLSLNQVAQEINISANYLSAIFSQELGKTFTEYVTGKRMELARELLRTTDKRSGEVAFAVGYRDPHYFSFLFKKTQGCTPKEYRAGGKVQ